MVSICNEDRAQMTERCACLELVNSGTRRDTFAFGLNRRWSCFLPMSPPESEHPTWWDMVAASGGAGDLTRRLTVKVSE